MSNKIYGLYLGNVTENNDPDGQMRIKVTIPDVLGEMESVWVLPCVQPGTRVLPPIGARIWIQFAGGDVERPVWMGTLDTLEPGLVIN